MSELNIIDGVNWSRGFFCNCGSILQEIVGFFNKNQRLPISIDSSQLFDNFKDNLNENQNFFKINDNFDIIYKDSINIDWYYYYKNSNLKPFIDKYFSPSEIAKLNIENIIKKYNIDFENTVYVLYRGNDKVSETQIASYDEFINQAEIIKQNNPDIRFMIQTDELEFKNEFINHFNNSFFIEEIPIINKDINKVVHHTLKIGEKEKFGINILSSIICGSKCKYIINSTGGCGLWVVLYRSNSINTIQYFNGAWI